MQNWIPVHLTDKADGELPYWTEAVLDVSHPKKIGGEDISELYGHDDLTGAKGHNWFFAKMRRMSLPCPGQFARLTLWNYLVREYCREFRTP